jgi:superoxide dismutase, Fe-Mn family
MAHNNHFFFRNLSANPTGIPTGLKRDLENSFSSIETLQREFILTASAMFGPGFVWLVKAGASDYRILTTYLAGSPYPGAHWRRQDTDMNTVGVDGTAGRFMRRSQGQSTEPKSDKPPGGLESIPLLCLNTWEHVWLRDYGIGSGGLGGKRAFAEAWWEAIDWSAVADAASITGRPALRHA